MLKITKENAELNALLLEIENHLSNDFMHARSSAEAKRIKILLNKVRNRTINFQLKEEDIHVMRRETPMPLG